MTLTEEQLASIRSQVRDKENRMRTTSLFIESCRVADNYPPIFTLSEFTKVKDGEEYIPLKQVYMSYDHVPGQEYQFAMDIFGSWLHWQKLLESTLKDYFQQWREELEIKMAARGFQAMVKAAKNPEKGVAAAKYLADRGWKPQRGRPSKEEVAREKRIAAGISSEIAEDAQRLGFELIAGGKK